MEDLIHKIVLMVYSMVVSGTLCLFLQVVIGLEVSGIDFLILSLLILNLFVIEANTNE